MNARLSRFRAVLRRAIRAALGASLAVFGLVIGPAVVDAQDFQCSEQAFDLASCADPTDLSTCTELPNRIRLSPEQEILRIVEVQDGPFRGVELSMEASNDIEDGRFLTARVQLCTQPATPPSTGDGNPLSPGVPTGPLWHGGDPGISIR